MTQPASRPAPFFHGVRKWCAVALLATLAGCASPPAADPARGASMASATTATPPRPRDAIDQQVALATFDAAWQRIHDSHFDATFNGVDWVAVREELRPQAMAATTNTDLRVVLVAMLDRLGQSHFEVIPAEAYVDLAEDEPTDDHANAGGAPTSEVAASEDSTHAASTPAERPRSSTGRPGSLGLEVRIVGGEVVVVRIDEDGPAALSGVRPGDLVESIDGRPTSRLRPLIARIEESGMIRYEANTIASASLSREEGEAVELVLRSPDGASRAVELVAVEMVGDSVSFPGLPPMISQVKTRAICANDLSAIGLSPCGSDVIGMVGFSIWMTPVAARFDAAMDEFRETLGVIIDLRGNPGGVGGMAMGFGGHFFEEPVSLGVMSTRENSLHFRVNPRRVDSRGRGVAPIDRPVAILVDEMSASTSEIFAGGMQESGRARIFGRTTPGAALPSSTIRLPNGDVLLAAFADFVTPQGVRLEGRGVVPDEVVVLTPENLASGIDPDLRAAAAWILDQWTDPEDADPAATDVRDGATAGT